MPLSPGRSLSQLVAHVPRPPPCVVGARPSSERGIRGLVSSPHLAAADPACSRLFDGVVVQHYAHRLGAISSLPICASADWLSSVPPLVNLNPPWPSIVQLSRPGLILVAPALARPAVVFVIRQTPRRSSFLSSLLTANVPASRYCCSARLLSFFLFHSFVHRPSASTERHLPAPTFARLHRTL